MLGSLRRHAEAFRSAWKVRDQDQSGRLPNGPEREFLPAVLELQESPPSPAARAIALTVITFFALTIIWASLGHIDIVAVARGRIIPSDYSKIIQPLESGVIKRIRVRDGQVVKKGDVLIELDATTAGADEERLANEHRAALTEVARLRALRAGQDTFEAPKGANPAFVEVQRARLREQLAELRVLESQAEAFKTLYEKRIASKLQYLENERKRAERAQEHAAALAEAETRAHSLSKELAKAETRNTLQTLTAPIDGVVQQLAVHTVGGVVTPAQQLMVIAPREAQLEVEAWIENKDIGFVNAGQDAEIKIESFPFTRYGVVEGSVLHVSQDAVPVDKIGLVYNARVKMSKTTMLVENGKEVPLSPGMAVTVEVKTGQRRLIEYFLSPLLRGVKEAARER